MPSVRFIARLFGWSAAAFCLAWAAPASAWSPGGNSSPEPYESFTVNVADRGDVLSFYHHIYLASSNYASQLGWTGSYDTCVVGTTSLAFREMVRRRVNYYRAMAGQVSDVTFDAATVVNSGGAPVTVPSGTSKHACAQAAALMMSEENYGFPEPYILNHSPPASFYCYSNSGWNGANHGNLMLSAYGPDAIDAYMLETDGTDINLNTDAGHRRWILYSLAKDMSTGDTPGDLNHWSTNCLYVTGTFKSSATPQWIAWPPAGHLPIKQVSLYWSLGYPGADFSAASVSMTNASGAPVSLTVISRIAQLGDNTIVWRPNGIPTSTTSDLLYNVSVTGIRGTGVPTSYSYQVKVINPYELGVSPSLTGTTTPPQSGALYAIAPVNYVDHFEVQTASTTTGTTTWTEGAESSATYTASTTNTTLQSATGAAISFSPHGGANAFHLTFTDEHLEDQIITFNSTFVPTSTSQLQFYTQQRFSTSSNVLRLEGSTDGGTTWSQIWSLQSQVDVTNSSQTQFERTWKSQTVSLSGYAGKWLKLRFSWITTDYYVSGTTQNFGIFIDDVALTNTRIANSIVSTNVPASSSSFDLSIAMMPGGVLTPEATYFLTYTPVISNTRFPFATPLTLIPTSQTGFSGWISGYYPQLATSAATEDFDGDSLSNLLEYALGTDPTSPTPTSLTPQPELNGNAFSICVSKPANVTGVAYSCQFSCDLSRWTDLPNSGDGTKYVFTKDTSGLSCGYLRIKVTAALP